MLTKTRGDKVETRMVIGEYPVYVILVSRAFDLCHVANFGPSTRLLGPSCRLNPLGLDAKLWPFPRWYFLALDDFLPLRTSNPDEGEEEVMPRDCGEKNDAVWGVSYLQVTL